MYFSKARIIILFMIVFSLGFISHSFIVAYGEQTSFKDVQSVQAISENDKQTTGQITNSIPRITYEEFKQSIANLDVVDLSESYEIPKDKASPVSRIKAEQVYVYEDRVMLDVKGAEWSKLTDTNSM